MSMPSSRLEVATTAGSRPALRSSSISARCSLRTEPWCARASTGGAPPAAPACAIELGRRVARLVQRPRAAARAQISLSRAVSRSASRRELANTMVERWASTRSTTRSSTCGQIDAALLPASAAVPARPRSRRQLGHVLDRHDDATGRTSWPPAAGRRSTSRAAGEERRDLVDRAHRGRQPDALRRPRPAARRGAPGDSARCAPRLVPATAWTSSTITVSTPRSDSRACEVSSRNSDSGVVIRMSGGLVEQRAALVGRGVAGADADRDVGLGQPEPRRLLPDAGQRAAQVALDVDGERLQRGDVQHPAAPPRLGRARARPPAGPAPRGTRPASCRSRWARRPARPARALAASHAPAWAAVGAANAAVNHARVAAENRSSTSSTLPCCTASGATSPAVIPRQAGRPDRLSARLGRCG